MENVKQLSTFDKGNVLRSIETELEGLGYTVESRVLNALDFGLPQKRERTIIVATRRPFCRFPWPTKLVEMTPLKDILESDPDSRHYVSDRIRRMRVAAHTPAVTPSIWHENKGGNVSSHEWSCALRAGASHIYLLVDGKRRLTPREQLRLQGFPDDWKTVCNDSETRKQTRNAVPVPMVQASLASQVDAKPQERQTQPHFASRERVGDNGGLGVRIGRIGRGCAKTDRFFRLVKAKVDARGMGRSRRETINGSVECIPIQ